MGSRTLSCATLVLGSVSVIAALSAGSDASHPEPTSAGKTLFMSHCASCHGEDARGAGPAAIALQVQPPDLTALAKLNHGKFPEATVRKSISGDGKSTLAHGSREMPTWGPLFLAMNGVNQKDAEKRIANLTEYLKSIQVK